MEVVEREAARPLVVTPQHGPRPERIDLGATVE
jgi:hypothetical protein